VLIATGTAVVRFLWTCEIQGGMIIMASSAGQREPNSVLCPGHETVKENQKLIKSSDVPSMAGMNSL
jgi:hypothetical protein